MFYHYDLHTHTKDGSRCGTMSAEEIVGLYKDLGYDGFCVTDHFTGNTTISEETPWEERIDRYFENYEKVCRAAEGRDISVFFGMEYSLMPYGLQKLSWSLGNDFLLFGLSRQWLKENQAAFAASANDLFDAVHQAGGYIVHAHPMKVGSWIASIQLFPEKVDAVEVANGGADALANSRALWYAQSFGLKMTGGSDAHHSNLKTYCGVQTDRKCHTIEELIEQIRSGRTSVFSGDAAHALTACREQK